MPIDPHTTSSLHQMLHAVVTVLAVINPLVCGAIFLTLTPKLEPPQRRQAAVRVALTILIILVASALIGLKVLSLFGISLDVFQIVGGMIIAYGLQYAQRSSDSWASATYERQRSHSQFTRPAHHVRRRSRDNYRNSDVGCRPHA